jgi:23S rRNA (cytidine1920-2'-O)/16S rRNA (cytidine1409-2'-O)-methyltransferase
VRRRLDLEMVRRGVAPTRSDAAVSIRAGLVTIGGRPALKASTLVGPDEPIAISGPGCRFVSRGGEKLDAALARFAIEVAGRRALDAGASTGGFTDCLLARGASAVVAVDVGYGQLDWRLRQDPRVVLMERTNVRDLRPDDLPYAPEVMAADLSFVSLRLAYPALARCAAPGADLVALVKPQFEAGRAAVGRGGVVRDANVWRTVLREVVAAALAEGFGVRAVMVSPLLGPAGNAEFLLWATARAVTGPLLDGEVDAAIADANALVDRGG